MAQSGIDGACPNSISDARDLLSRQLKILCIQGMRYGLIDKPILFVPLTRSTV